MVECKVTRLTDGLLKQVVYNALILFKKCDVLWFQPSHLLSHQPTTDHASSFFRFLARPLTTVAETQLWHNIRLAGVLTGSSQ